MSLYEGLHEGVLQNVVIRPVFSCRGAMLNTEHHFVIYFDWLQGNIIEVVERMVFFHLTNSSWVPHIILCS